MKYYYWFERNTQIFDKGVNEIYSNFSKELILKNYNFKNIL